MEKPELGIIKISHPEFGQRWVPAAEAEALDALPEPLRSHMLRAGWGQLRSVSSLQG